MFGHKAKGPVETLPKNPGKLVEYKYHRNRLQPMIDHFKNYLLDPGSKKLFVVVDRNLSSAQKAVQAAHAVAKFQSEHPESLWINGTLIILQDKESSRMSRIRNRITGFFSEVPFGNQIPYASFKSVWTEEDMDNKVTAYAVLFAYSNDFGKYDYELI